MKFFLAMALSILVSGCFNSEEKKLSPKFLKIENDCKKFQDHLNQNYAKYAKKYKIEMLQGFQTVTKKILHNIDIMKESCPGGIGTCEKDEHNKILRTNWKHCKKMAKSFNLKL